MATDAVKTEPIAPEYIQSVEQGWANTQGAYGVRATQILADISQNREVSSYGTAAAGLIRDGMYEGSLEQKSNYLNWTKSIEDQSTEIRDTDLQELNVSAINLTIRTESLFTLNLQERNKTFHTLDKIKVYGVEDPILTQIGVNRDIKACYFNNLAKKIYSGSASSGTARGIPVVNPADPSSVTSRGQKILITSNISQYEGQENVTDDYAGYYSRTEPANPSSYNQRYVVGGGKVPQFENNERAIINEGLWRANFFRVRDNKCYLPTAQISTPSITDRIYNQTRGDDAQGIFTILSIGANSESDIGYERVDGSGLTLVQIEGVSVGQGETWPEFRMSQGLAEEIGISGLIE